MDTQVLQTYLEKTKVREQQKAKAQDEPNYSWKFSVVKHRKQRSAWEIFIIFIALYSVVVIPIRIGVNEHLFDPAYDVIDMITWLFYIGDVFVNLRTTYIDSFGLEVVDSSRIMKKYVGSFRFILDILSLFNLPTYFSKHISQENLLLVLNLLGMLKISRYFRA